MLSCHVATADGEWAHRGEEAGIGKGGAEEAGEKERRKLCVQIEWGRGAASPPIVVIVGSN